jgi:light-regulated signal transduction histidine kinase (bacteriophytochrome)/HAMP domain-containing protein
VDQVITQLIAVQTHVGIDLKRKGDITFNRAKWTMTLAGLIGVLFAVVLGFTISRGITVPLSAITTVARTVSGGKMDVGQLGGIATRRDEIGVLAWAFTLMAGQLKETLEGLHQSREELEKRVLERTSALQRSNKQLENEIEERRQAESQLVLRSQELARTSTHLGTMNKELDAFAYSVSHDLRAPLRHVDGFVELLRKRAGKALDAKCQHYMETISKSVQRMGRLIDDLLYFSRMGRQALSFAPVNMKSLARRSILELGRDTGGREIDWCIGDLPVVLGDASLLRVVFDNLISNSIKFSFKEKKIQIEIRALSGRNSETVFIVRDNGVGFDMKYVDKLFGVFQRLHNADKYEGTGIGLANVYRIINRHGGRVWAQGKPDKGAVFFFSLPDKQKGDSYE